MVGRVRVEVPRVIGTSFTRREERAGRTTMKLHHEPVLASRVLEWWASPSAERLVDGTVGRAGHSLMLLSERPEVKLLCVDRDLEAVEAARRRLEGFGDRAKVVHGSFAELPRLLSTWETGGAKAHTPVDGILLDLGVSSPQIDDPSRGFSLRSEGPLDFRFDQSRGESAADWIEHADPEELAKVLREYGEVPSARRVAGAILEARQVERLSTTASLRRAVEGALVRRGEPLEKSLARVFQAIRIRVNDELGELQKFLAALPSLLAPEGRVAIISFHSLEDRLVKHAFREAARDCVCPKEIPICMCGGGKAWLRVLTPRAVRATQDEIARNPRARSAKLRVAERTRARGEDLE
jgi:16S rRNA (cytosine1402-N4)-methyltransferase